MKILKENILRYSQITNIIHFIYLLISDISISNYLLIVKTIFQNISELN